MESHKVSKTVLVLTCLPLLFSILSVRGFEIELYSEKDRRGQSIKIDVGENECSELPLAWHSGVASVDTLGNCVQFYDEPKCKGSLTVMQPFHIIHQMDLSLINYAYRLRTASACGPKIFNGRYVIQNAADASVMAALNKHGNFAKTFTVNTTKSAAVPKTQQWEVVEKTINEYILKPRENSDNYPVSFDEESLKKGVIKRKTWRIMSVGRGRYIIKDTATQRCLYKTDDHSVEEHSCRIWSTNQEWVFRTIVGDPPSNKPKAQVGDGLNYNILSKVATSRPPTRPPPTYYPIHFNVSKLAAIKKFSTASPYTIKKKIKRGPRPKTKYYDEPSMDLKPPGLRPAIPKNVANNNNYLTFKAPNGPAQDSYLPQFIPTDDLELLPTKEMIKSSAQYMQYVDIVKQYLVDQALKYHQQQQILQNPKSDNVVKTKVKVSNDDDDAEEEEGEEEEQDEEEDKDKEEDDKESDESVSEAASDSESKVTESSKSKGNGKNKNSGEKGNHIPEKDIGEPQASSDNQPGFMSQVFNKFKSNFAAIVPSVDFKLPKLPSLPSVPVPKLSLTFSKGGSDKNSDKSENDHSANGYKKKKKKHTEHVHRGHGHDHGPGYYRGQKHYSGSSGFGASQSGFTYSFSGGGAGHEGKGAGNVDGHEKSEKTLHTGLSPANFLPTPRPGRFSLWPTTTTTKMPLTMGSWGIFG